MCHNQNMTVQTASVADRVCLALQVGLGNNLVSLVLFGSRARGDARQDSDWDFLVIAHGLSQDVFDRHISLKRLLPPDVRGTTSLLARTPTEFETAFSALYLDIATDGQILFDSNQYIHNKLKNIQQWTTELGYIRQHSPAGDIWLQTQNAPVQSLNWLNHFRPHAT